jgi:hypothetical protein
MKVTKHVLTSRAGKKIGMQETKEIKYEVGSHAYFSPKLA